MKKISWTEYGIEIIVVIIGITIAFALNSWGEKQKALESEKNYLSSLLIDLKSDTASMRQNIDSTKSLISNATELFSILYNPARPLDDLKHYHITGFYNSLYFNPANGTYNALMGSGDLELIRNFELRSGLSELYSVHYRDLEDMDRFVRNLVDQNIYPYMLQNINFSRSGIVSDDPLKTVEFTNLSGSFINISHRKINVYSRIIKETTAMIVLIENEVQ